MKPYSKTDKKFLAAIGCLSGFLALGCLIVGLEATHYDMEAFANPVKLLEMADISPSYIRWFMLLDMVGYYLLLLPLIFYIHRHLEHRTPWALLFTSLGFGYVLIGAIGAAVLSIVWPSLIEKYAVATSALQEIYKSDFILITDFVVKGMWNYLEVLLGGIWWMAVGFFINGYRGLKIITLVLGIAGVVDSIGELAGLPILAELGLNLYLLLAIIWPIWTGIAIGRNRFQFGPGKAGNDVS